MELSLIALSATVISNVCFSLGFGTLGVIPHKKNAVFMLVSNLMILILSTIAGMLYYVLYNFVFVPLEITELAIFSGTIIVLLLDYIAMIILKKVSRESFYHYEKNFMFVIHAVVVLGMLFASNVALNFVTYLFSIAMQFLGFFVINVLFFAMNSRVNSKDMPEHIRALPPQLVLMSVFALMCYLITGLLV